MSLKKIIGIFIGFIGAILVIVHPVLNGFTFHTGSFKGNILIFIGAILYSLYIVLSKRLQQKYSASYITAMFIIITAVTSLILSVSDFFLHPMWWKTISIQVIYSLIAVSSIGTVGYYYLYQYAIKKGGPVAASMIQYLTPATTFIFAFVMLQEQLTSWFIFGALLTLFGAWLVTNKQNTV